VTAAMLAAIGGMVAWLFLVPEGAPTDAVLTLGTFVALAVPSTLVPEERLDPAWRRLVTSLPRAPASRRGPVRPSTAWVTAAILGWPPLVAALLHSGRPTAALGAAWVAGMVVLAAAATSAIAVPWPRRGGAETRLAVALLAAVAVGLVLLAAGGLRTPR